MNSSMGKRKDEKQLTVVRGCGSVNSHCERDFKSEMISQMVLNDILQKAQQIKNRNSQLNHFIQSQKLKQSEQFTVNNSTQVLENFFIKPQSLSPQMTNENSMASPSKSPFSFLNYEQLTLETDRSNNGRQTWEDRRNSTKIINCNKIYILKKKQTKPNSLDKNFSIKSIKLNDTLPSGFGRASYRPQIKKVSINQGTLVPRLSSNGRSTVNLFGSAADHGSKNNLLHVSKNTIIRSSFHDENIIQKEEQDKTKLIKLENNYKRKDLQKFDPKDKQTNQHIAFLRQRKQKLQNIMKVFDLDDQQKKNHKIQRQNLLKETKPENLAETFSKMPSMTTDYEGNPVYFQDPFIKTQRNLQNNSKKSYTKLPKYQTHEEGALSHNVNFKIKDIDDKTQNFLNQIFSSASGSPIKTSNKKITFNMKSLEVNKKSNGKRNQKTEKNMSSKISVNYKDKRQDIQKFKDQDLQTESFELNNPKVVKNIYDNGKGMKSALKLPLKNILDDSYNSTNDKNKENIPFEKPFGNSKHQGFLLNRQKTHIRTEQSSRSNIINKHSLKQLQTMHRQGYASHKQRIHPNLSKLKKTTTISTEQNDFNKIVETSNETKERNHTESQHKPLKMFFERFLAKITK